eukprot:1104012-Amphidinium_carterae.1
MIGTTVVLYECDRNNATTKQNLRRATKATSGCNRPFHVNRNWSFDNSNSAHLSTSKGYAGWKQQFSKNVSKCIATWSAPFQKDYYENLPKT